MSTYDDWVVRFKTDTTALDKALEKVNKLRAAMNGLHGNSSGGTGRGPTRQTSTSYNPTSNNTRPLMGGLPSEGDYNRSMTAMKRYYQQLQAERRRDFYDSQRHLNHHTNLVRNSERMEADRQRRLERERLQRQRASGGNENNSASWSRRRSEAIRQLTAENPAARNMRSYYAQQEAQANARRSAIEQARQVELATMNANARRQAERERQRQMDRAEREAHAEKRRRTGQAAADIRNGNRASNFSAAQRTREMRLDALSHRMGRYGVGNQTELAGIRQALGAARNQTDLNALAPRMNEFVRSTNQAISAQARLERQMQRNNFAVRSMSNSMANLARSYLSIYAVMGGAGSMYRNAKEMENLQTKLLMGTGSKAGASEAFEYVKGRAKLTGSDITSSTNLYAQMAITAKDSGLSKEQIKKVYEDTSTMQIGYGLTADQQKLTTKAIIQMMSCSLRNRLLRRVIFVCKLFENGEHLFETIPWEG